MEILPMLQVAKAEIERIGKEFENNDEARRPLKEFLTACLKNLTAWCIEVPCGRASDRPSFSL